MIDNRNEKIEEFKRHAEISKVSTQTGVPNVFKPLWV